MLAEIYIFIYIMMAYRAYERGHGMSLTDEHTIGLCAGLRTELM